MSQMSDFLDPNDKDMLMNDPDVKHNLHLIEDVFSSGAYCLEPIYGQDIIGVPTTDQSQIEQLDSVHHNLEDPLRHSVGAAALPLLQIKQEADHLEYISTEEFAGEYEFDVTIDPGHGTKSPWVFSVVLKKIFILMDASFPINLSFKWPQSDKLQLFVRSTPCFSDPHCRHELVTRCPVHVSSSFKTNENVPKSIHEHILRCRNANATYHGSKLNNRHLSVRVPLGYKSAGTVDTIRNLYQFVCKNSCPQALNRKPFELVFTLEDQYENVLGRRILPVRVCSCPKRDRDKEERDYRRLTNSLGKANSGLPQGKKRPISEIEGARAISDSREFKLNLTVRGKKNAVDVYQFVHDRIAGEIPYLPAHEGSALNQQLLSIKSEIRKIENS